MASLLLKAVLVLIQVTCIAAVELSPDGLNVCCDTLADGSRRYSCCEGWTNGTYDDSDCVMPICNIPCGEHGACTSPDVCTCLPGYVGEICDTDIDNKTCTNWESNTMYDARLLYGKEPHTGLVQIRSEAGTWSYIHPNTWSRNNSHVLCQQLGYSFAYYLSDGDWTDNLENSFSFLDIRFECSGNEDALHDCDVVQVEEEISDDRMVVIQCYVQSATDWCNSVCDQDTESRFGCKCDPLCSNFRDCCPDYFNNEKCPSEIDVLVEETCLPMPFHHEPSFSLPNKYDVGYFFISNCNSSRVYDDISKLCESQPDMSDPLSFTPVQERNSSGTVKRVYRNIFCAICNLKSIHELQAWDIVVEEGTNNRTNLVIHNIIPPNGEAGPRTCLLNLESESTCYGFHRNVKYSCANDYAPLYVQDKGYQNMFCAVCDNVYPHRRHSYAEKANLDLPMDRRQCTSEIYYNVVNNHVPFEFPSIIEHDISMPVLPPSLITIFDFGSDGNAQNRCSEGEMYDYFSQRCRLLSCPTGFPLSNGSCKAVERSPVREQPKVIPIPEHELPKEIKVPNLELPKEIRERGPDNFDNNQTVECMHDVLAEYFQTLIYPQNNEFQLPLTYITGNSDTIVVHANPSSFSQLARSVNDILTSEYRNDLEEEQMCNVSSLFVLQELHDNVVDESKNDSIICILGNQMIGCVSIDSLNHEITTNIRSYEFTWKNETNCYQITMTWGACFDTSFDIGTSCAEIKLAPDEFEIYYGTNTSRVLLKASGKELSTNEFRFGENGTLFVCASAFYPTEHESSNLDLALSYVTSICFVISLVATFFTFISYCFFRKLRNVSGYTVINLSIAFFVAQLAFLLSPHMRRPSGLCLTSAVIGHFAWLSGFFWMNALSFVTTLNLSRNTLVRDKTVETCRLLRYMVYAWGSPLLIVVVCLSLHYCDCTDIAPIYGLKGNSICWLIGQDGYANLWGFAGPVLALLFCNIVLFIHAIVALRTKMASTKRSLKKAKEEIAIYVKLTSLMGLPWMLGFLLAFIPKIHFGDAYIYLNYIYTILNSLQGFFIFWVLVLTGRAGKLWHRKLCGLRGLLGTKERSSKPTAISSGKTATTSFTVSSLRSQGNSSSDVHG